MDVGLGVRNIIQNLLDIALDLYSLGTCSCQSRLVVHGQCEVSMYCAHCVLLINEDSVPPCGYEWPILLLSLTLSRPPKNSNKISCPFLMLKLNMWRVQNIIVFSFSIFYYHPFSHIFGSFLLCT